VTGAAVLVVCALGSSSGQDRTDHWVTSWATAQQLAPTQGPGRGRDDATVPRTLKNQTIRMIARTSIGGRRLRVQLSNALDKPPLVVGAAHVALRQKESAIVAASDRRLTFGGRPSFVVPPGSMVVSDPVDLVVPSLSELAVSVYLPNDTGPPTAHSLGLHTAYIADGDATGSEKPNGAATTTAYLWLSSVDVLAPASAAAIVAFGDSITDGYATSVDKDRAWPFLLSARFAANGSTAMRGVLNLGISGNRVLRHGVGLSALARFDRDVLGRAGVTWMILFEGINDITFPAIPGMSSAEAVRADDLIWGYRQIVDRAHMHGIKVAGATIMPVEGVVTYTDAGEAIRQTVNQWIRTGGAFDAVIDFDALVRDAGNPKRLRADFDPGDHVHPNDNGNEAMAAAIDMSMFLR
jgi:lysophospholipase L1-like esterase